MGWKVVAVSGLIAMAGLGLMMGGQFWPGLVLFVFGAAWGMVRG